MQTNPLARMTAAPDLDTSLLAERARDVLKRCQARGADAVEIGVSEEYGLNVGVRLGDVETLEHSSDRGLSITVYFGQRKGSASTADFDPSSIEASIEQACAIARYTEEDPFAGLADPQRMATDFPDLDLWHPQPLDVDHAIASALACEAAGREDKRITNVDGTNWSSGGSAFAYANSHGFVGVERGTSHTISCSLIAGKGDAMQRDYWYDNARNAGDISSPEAIGHRAAERTLARLNPRPMKTGRYPVLYSAELARSLVGHFLSAVAGSSQYRRASFLLDACGKAVFPDWLSMTERPHLPRGHRSANFDAEGVGTVDRPLVVDGHLARYVLGSYSARKLGLESTGNAGGMHNLELTCGDASQAELIRQMGSGLLLTELMGQGVNGITGDYSRGAAGFWVENGEIAYPVDGITVAGNLRDIFVAIEAIGADIDPRSHIRTGSILVGAMTVAAD